MNFDPEKYTKASSNNPLEKNQLNLSIDELQKLNHLLIISKMIPQGLYFIGIIIKCNNDDNRPNFSPSIILNIINGFFGQKMKDFISVILTNFTFAKLVAKSANFGDIDYKCKEGMNEKYGSIHFCLKVNLELFRIYYPNISIIQDNE